MGLAEVPGSGAKLWSCRRHPAAGLWRETQTLRVALPRPGFGAGIQSPAALNLALSMLGPLALAALPEPTLHPGCRVAPVALSVPAGSQFGL